MCISSLNDTNICSKNIVAFSIEEYLTFFDREWICTSLHFLGMRRTVPENYYAVLLELLIIIKVLKKLYFL
jgi:hypothetical protein